MKRDKPLPLHTRFDYYECYAKIALEKLFPNQFHLELKDRPDLQDQSAGIGIEVTQGIDPKQQEIESLFTKIIYDGEVDTAKLERQIEKLGGELNGGVLSGVAGQDDFANSIKVFKQKVAKVNSGGYQFMKRYDLFIFDDCLDMTAERSIIRNVSSQMQQYQSDKEVKYQNVYICTPGILWHLNLLTEDVNEYDISKVQFDWALKARVMVEMGECGFK